MKEKRTVYIVEKYGCCIYKVFDTLAEAKMYMLHEYLKWVDTDTILDHNKLDWFVSDIKNIDEHAYVEDLFYLHEAEYCGE